MYRDEYAALQARADATQRNLEELRADTSGDKDKIAALERELASTAKELKALQRKLGLAPRNPAPMIAGGIVVVLSVGAGMAFFSLNERKLDAKEAMFDAKLQASLQEVAKVTIDKTMKESCTPLGQGVIVSNNVPFVVIERPEGCFPRMLPMDANKDSEGGAPNKWMTIPDDDFVVINNEEEFQEHYYCPDKKNKDEERPSGLDFKRFRLVVSYGMVAKPTAAFVVKSQSKIVAGIQPVIAKSDLNRPTEDILANPNAERFYQAAEFLIPAGDEPVESKTCLPRSE